MATVAFQFKINGATRRYDGDGAMPLLWYPRENEGLVGAKFGCGLPTCGACKVIVDEQLVPACAEPLANLSGAQVRTIEGLAKGSGLYPVQQAWIDENVAQCGYCQAGQIMATFHLLERNDNPPDEEIGEAVTNLCRCGTYAIRAGAELFCGTLDQAEIAGLIDRALGLEGTS